MRFRNILALLIVLLAADCILTSVAVGYLGATEMNPLYYRVGGLPAFIALKVLVSIVAVTAIVLMERTQPKIAASTCACCCVVYGGAFAGIFIWNVGMVLL